MINTAPIQSFIQQVKAADQSNQREIKIDMRVAKNLVFSLTEILAKLTEDQEALIKKISSAVEQSKDQITIQMDGGGF